MIIEEKKELTIDEIAENFIKNKEKTSGRAVRHLVGRLLREFARHLKNNIDAPVGLSIPNNPNYSGNLRIAFIIQNVGHMTGGRYYAWFVAMALVELGFDITVYTNLTPGFYDNFKDYKRPKVVVPTKDAKDLGNLDVEADVYIGAPIFGALAASRLGKKYSKPSFALVFDPWSLMEKYMSKEEHYGWYAGWDDLIPTLRNSNTKIISLCETTSEHMYEWLNKKKSDVMVINPCINSKEAAKAEVGKRGDYVVFMSRLAKHKNIEHVLQAVKDNNIKLKIISSTQNASAPRMVADMGLKDQVEFLIQIGDAEKFKIISESRGVINASIFEGWGMWASEAIRCGVPLICYEYPTIREQEEISGAENIYFAEWNNPKALSQALKEALSEGKFHGVSLAFNFERMIERVGELFNVEPKIGVITIALNEDKFIGASLRSVMQHPSIKKIAVVEGAVNLFAHASTEQGLSVDKTNIEVLKVMKDTNKIIFDRYGWATDKSELRNRALELLGTDITHVLVVDADEVYAQEDLDKLVKAMKENPTKGVFEFHFLHFFKSMKQVATGGQWNSKMFRCFKYADKSLRWNQHQLPPASRRGYINETDGAIVVDGMKVFHMGYVKEEKRVLEKLDYYKRRDKHLKVDEGIYLNWEPGKPSQPTHGGGDVVNYDGSYPPELKGFL